MPAFCITRSEAAFAIMHRASIRFACRSSNPKRRRLRDRFASQSLAPVMSRKKVCNLNPQVCRMNQAKRAVSDLFSSILEHHGPRPDALPRLFLKTKVEKVLGVIQSAMGRPVHVSGHL